MSAQTTITLASASPRRKELITQMGLPLRIMPVDVDESFTDQPPIEDTVRLAELKIRTFLSLHGEMAYNWVLTADTIVEIEGKKIGKPENEEEAREMLSFLSGRTHTVVTGLAFFSRGKGVTTDYALTDVTFSPLSPEEVDSYLSSQEWVGVAAAYRIQERGSCFISEIRGSYSNVMGLPIHTFYGMLRQHDYPHLTALGEG